jgi:hypothetical protein
MKTTRAAKVAFHVSFSLLFDGPCRARFGFLFSYISKRLFTYALGCPVVVF